MLRNNEIWLTQLITILRIATCNRDANATVRVPSAGKGLGLLGIRERVALLGGSVDIESDAGQGTTLYVHIPLDNSNPPAGA